MSTSASTTAPHPIPEPQALLDVGQVAHKLNVHPKTVRRLMEAGKFPKSVRLGRAQRWKTSEVEQWLDNLAG
jgi:excisionase family DNA binding protein